MINTKLSKNAKIGLCITIFFALVIISRAIWINIGNDIPVQMKSKIVLCGNIRSTEKWRLLTYNAEKGVYAETNLASNVDSASICEVVYALNRWWVIVLYDKAEGGFGYKLHSIDGKQVFVDFPSRYIIGGYQGRLWYLSDNHICGFSIADGSIIAHRLPYYEERSRITGLSDDGIFASSDYSHLVLISVTTGEKVNEYPDIFCYSASISPSGKKVAVRQSSGISIYDISQTTPKMIAEYKCYSMWKYKWSFDENYLIINETKQQFIPILPSGVGQLGIFDIAKKDIVWLSANIASRSCWDIGDGEALSK